MILLSLVSTATNSPKPVLLNESDNWNVVITLPYTYGVKPNITIRVQYKNGRPAEDIMIPRVDISIRGNTITFPLPDDISGNLSVAYSMSFFGETSEMSEFSDERGQYYN